ncbi:diacylglycerol/lipid kinase family protein [Pararhizobium mangrovi]|uniref:diacylglycerol/lipid kinase family protein n=1 Tax=Pararhizobium mangrovi TaxID=2590452 RepID=UPI0015E85431|nr:diacylglycerol kinase family protein [Pararhizobium mangrovi]
MRIGIVYNPKSRRNRGRPVPDGEGLAGSPALRAPASHEDLLDVLDEFAAIGIDCLAIDGGDGTIRDVLGAAVPRFAEMPAVALLDSGTTNVIARDVGAWGHGDRALERLVRTVLEGAGANRRRHLIRVDDGQVCRFGFVLGAGAFRRAVALSHTGVRAGFGQRLKTGAALAGALGSVSFGRERALWRAGTPMTLDRDGRERGEPRFIFLATTLERLMLGIYPFWGEGEGSLRYLDVAAPPHRLGAALVPVLRGRPRRWMEDAGYRSGRANGFSLAIDEPFVLDGEEYELGRNGRIDVAAGPHVTFLVP